MAIWEKLFSKITFKDYPDTSTPLNASNMNVLSDAIDGIDDRVVELNSNLGNLPGLMQSGKLDIVTSTSEKEYTVTFDKQFSSVSSIQLTVSSYGYSDNTSVVVKSYTPTSLTFTVISKNANVNQSIYWLVIGK